VIVALVVLSLGMGGQERLVVRMAHGLRARGHEAHVVTLTRGGALRSDLDGIPVHEVVRREGFDPRLYTKLWRCFRRLRVDVVHTHNAAPLVYAAPAARLAGAKTIVHTKHGDFRYPKRTLRLARLASRVVHHFVAVSPETADAARRNERPTRVVVIENGIPLDVFGSPPAGARESVRAELGIPRDAEVIGSVGRLVPEKDFALLVRATVPILGEKMRLVLVGEGPARSDIESAIPDHARRFVVLTGARRDVPSVLAAFDVFASSSRTEGLPLAIPEAMSAGLPVVATAVGGVPGIVPPEAGRLVPHGDEAALRAAIREMLADAPERGRRARDYATLRFGEDRMMNAYLALYAGRPWRCRRARAGGTNDGCGRG
jgi:glycosyltransferase involved in cell wall biosynthesis